jgi:DNA-binding NarL/FixJ family response regulator
MGEILDLFGDPVPANWGQRGRPEHIPTQQNRNRVSMLVALGWSNKRIAAALFVTHCRPCGSIIFPS